MQEVVVVIVVGAGPSGIATSVCLNQLSIPNIVLEQEDCSASLWKKRAYDRLNLHLDKKYCSLPHMPHPSTSPIFLSKNDFINYLDDYVSHFEINPNYCRKVVSAFYDKGDGKWRIETKNTMNGDVEVYVANFLVVATGENGEGLIPKIYGLDSFKGEILHSRDYKSGGIYKDKKVLVVGCGNSGMEIAYDLSNFGAHTSIVVRSEFHVVNKEMIRFGMKLLKYMPVSLVDGLVNFLARIEYGDLSEYGIHRPLKGVFYLKATKGRSPVIDVGTVNKIKSKEIEILPAISNIEENKVQFENDVKRDFDVIVFATGYKSLALNWLKDYEYVLNESGMPKEEYPIHYKGENGVYCAGLSKRGLLGVSMDAMAIAKDIHLIIIAQT